MTKKLARRAAAALLAAAACFFAHALRHPEQSFPWPNGVTYTLYALYFAAAVVLLLAPFQNSEK